MSLVLLGVVVSSLASYAGDPGSTLRPRIQAVQDSCLKWRSTPAIIVKRGLQQVYQHKYVSRVCRFMYRWFMLL